MLKRISLSVSVAVVAAMTMFTATPQVFGQASFRGGVLLPSIDSGGILTVTSITFWDDLAPLGGTQGARDFINPKVYVAGNVGNAGDPERDDGVDDTLGNQSIFDMTYGSLISEVGPADPDGDARFYKRTETFTVNLNSVTGLSTGDNVEVIWGTQWMDDIFGPTAHIIGPNLVNGIPNHSNQNFFIKSEILWDAAGNVNPVIFNFNGVQFDVTAGVDYASSLGATTGASGGSLMYNLDLDEKFNPNVPATPGTDLPPGLTVSPNGTLSSPAASTATWETNTGGNPDADEAFGGFITAMRGGTTLASVEYFGIFDVVGANDAPIVGDIFVTISAGDLFTPQFFTGTDPDGDDNLLVWSLLNDLAGPTGGVDANTTFTGGTGSASGNFTWSFTLVSPGVYVATVQARDVGGLADAGNLFITVLPAEEGVPEPATLGLLGLGCISLLRRRRRLA